MIRIDVLRLREALIRGSPLSNESKEFICGNIGKNNMVVDMLIDTFCIVASRKLADNDLVLLTTISNSLEILGFADEADLWRNSDASF